MTTPRQFLLTFESIVVLFSPTYTRNMHSQIKNPTEEPTFDTPDQIKKDQAISILVVGNLCDHVRAAITENLGIEGMIVLSHEDFQSLSEPIKTNTILVKDEEEIQSRPVEDRARTLETLRKIQSKHLDSLPDDHLIIIVSNTRDSVGFFTNIPELRNQTTIPDENPEIVIREIFLRKEELLKQ
jgi:hypothetical protein